MATTHNYSFPPSRKPGATIQLDRVNVFLGANGTGKSQMLKEIKANYGAFGKDPIYVEGGRALFLIDNLTLNNNNFNQFANLERAKFQNKHQHANENLVNRIQNELYLIDLLDQEIKKEHSDAVTEWLKNSSHGKCPERKESPFERLFGLFTEIFPTISLKYNSESKVLRCIKGDGPEYSPVVLSDGEKQILSLLADIVILGGDNRLVVVDEPELNLNSGLANRFWDIVENELGSSVFVYATHNISFAMRKSVERIYVLGNNKSEIVEIENISELSNRELSELLGSIPAILSSTFAIGIEGRENSIDSVLYRWLIGKDNCEIVPLGGCEDVRSAANKTGIWKRLAPSVQLLGVIDRDYRSNKFLDDIAMGNCVVLQYHEIESYLCYPAIVCQVANSLGLVENLPTEQIVNDIIIKEFKEKILHIIAKRAFFRLSIKLGVSINNNALSKITTLESLKETLIIAALEEKTKADKVLSPANVSEIIAEETLLCEKALHNGNIDEVLLLMPAKELLNKLIALVGCKNILQMARAAVRHVKIDTIPILVALKNSLLKTASLEENNSTKTKVVGIGEN